MIEIPFAPFPITSDALTMEWLCFDGNAFLVECWTGAKSSLQSLFLAYFTEIF